MVDFKQRFPVSNNIVFMTRMDLFNYDDVEDEEAEAEQRKIQQFYRSIGEQLQECKNNGMRT